MSEQGRSAVSGGIQQRTAQVAAAIRDAYNEVVFGESNDEAWRRLAEAAIEALQLREEWGVVTDMGISPHKPWTEEQARKAAAKWPDMTVRHRLATPWVPVGGNQ